MTNPAKRPLKMGKANEKFGGSVELPLETVSSSPLGAAFPPRSKSDIPKRHGLPPAAYEEVKVEGNYALSPRSGSFHFDLPPNHEPSSSSHVHSLDAERSSPMSPISEVSPRTRMPARKPVPGSPEHIKSMRRKLTATDVIPDGYEGEVFNVDAAREGEPLDSQALHHEKMSVLHLKQALDSFRFNSKPMNKPERKAQGEIVSNQHSPLQSSPPDHPTWSRKVTEEGRPNQKADTSSRDVQSERPPNQQRSRSYKKTRPHAIIVPAQKHSKQSTVERKSSMESEIVLRRGPMPTRSVKHMPSVSSTAMEVHKSALPVDAPGNNYSPIQPASSSESASLVTNSDNVDDSAMSIPTSILVNPNLQSMNTSLRYVFEADSEGQSQQEVHILSSRMSPTTAISISPSDYSQSGPPSTLSLSTSRTSTSPGCRISLGSPIYSASSVTRMYKPLTPPIKIDIPSPKKQPKSRSQTHLTMTEESPYISPSSQPHFRSRSSGDVPIPNATRVKATSMTIGDIQDLVSEKLVNERQRQLSRPAMSTINSSDSMGMTPRAPYPSKADAPAGTTDNSYFSDTSGEEENWI